MNILFLALFPFFAHAAPRLPELKFTSPDTAEAVYADKCSNGANHDAANRDKFVKRMLANPKSKLAQLKADLFKGLSDPRGEGVFLGQFVETYNDREGCSTSSTSFSAVMVTMSGGNSDHTVTRYLITIDDDEDSGLRKLSLRSQQPLAIRDDQ